MRVVELERTYEAGEEELPILTDVPLDLGGGPAQFLEDLLCGLLEPLAKIPLYPHNLALLVHTDHSIVQKLQLPPTLAVDERAEKHQRLHHLVRS